MSIIVTGKLPSVRYTKIPNALIRCKDIADSTFRFICWMCSHQEGFTVTFKSIQSQLGYGIDKLRAVLNQAEKFNYLIRRRRNGEGGKFEWEYHVFIDPEDAAEYRDSLYSELKSECGVSPSGVKPIYGETHSMGEPVDGLSPPHNKEQYREDQKKEEQGKENPPIVPQTIVLPEEGGDCCIVAEIVEPENQEIKTSYPDISLIPESSKLTLKEKSVPGDETKSSGIEKVSAIEQIFEDTGKVLNYGLEYKIWIQAKIGDVIKLYRKSGRALTTNPNDIDSDFKSFTAKNGNGGKGLKLSAAQGWIVNCEQNPLRWGELRDLVAEWVLAKTTGDRNLSLANEHERASKPRIELNFR